MRLAFHNSIQEKSPQLRTGRDRKGPLSRECFVRNCSDSTIDKVAYETRVQGVKIELIYYYALLIMNQDEYDSELKRLNKLLPDKDVLP